MVIGQGCLSVELNAAERRKVGRGTDAIFFIFMVPELRGNQTVSRLHISRRRCSRAGSVEWRGTDTLTLSSRRRVDDVEDDATILHEGAMKF